MNKQSKIIRTATVAMSLDLLLRGQLNYLNTYFDIKAVSGLDAHLETVAKRECISVIDVKMSRPISPLNDLKSLIRLYKVFKKEKPQIVHSITPKAGLLSMVAARLAHVPIRIHTFTGLIFPYKTGIMQQVLILMDKILCKNATHIFPEGEGVKNDLIQYNITDKPLHIIANGNVNGINLDDFKPDNSYPNLRPELGITTPDFVYCFVGRLVKDKGINELVNAFVQLNQVYSNTKLLLVGPFEHELDPLDTVTLDTITKHPHIITTGFVSDIRPYLQLSDCFVFPSYREGFPNVVLQAGAMGLPSIVTDISGSNEIIRHQFNGLICKKKDTDGLYQQMKLLYTDNSLRESLILNARPHIAKRYNQKYVWECLKNKYESLLKNV